MLQERRRHWDNIHLTPIPPSIHPQSKNPPKRFTLEPVNGFFYKLFKLVTRPCSAREVRDKIYKLFLTALIKPHD